VKDKMLEAYLESAAEKLSEPEYDAVSEKNYTIGQVVGIEGIASSLRERAGKMFASNNDSQAVIYRDLAKELDEKASAMRKDYIEKYGSPSK
jgi:hypothetical protein